VTPAATDLTLAIAHHLLIFALAGLLAFEIAVIRNAVSHENVSWLSRVDIFYAIIAVLILAVGFSRAIFAAKGWAYYSHNLLFWAKVTAFAIVALLSAQPTIHIVRWRQSFAGNSQFVVDPADIRLVRRFLLAEAALFALLPVFAAGMARGYGLL
jgi:putative membrane protein